MVANSRPRCLSWLALACLCLVAQRPVRAAATVVLEGEIFPAATFQNLNAGAGRAATVDLTQVVGKKPVVLCYWIAGNPRAEQLLQQLEKLTQELGDSVALYSFVMQRPGREADAVRERIKAMNLRVPVLDDVDFRVGKLLRVQSVPDVTILDKTGRMRLSNGASLVQTLEYKMNLEGAIRRVATTGTLGTYGYLERYYPVEELVGKKCPDFRAPLLTNSVERRWAELQDSAKVNVLIFWSVDCAHCRQTLPEINAWLKQNPSGVNVVSAASVSNPATKTKTREFCDLNGFVFPTLADQDRRISDQFQVTSTPTILVIGPDGVINSVMLSDLSDFGKTIEEKKRALLKAAGS